MTVEELEDKIKDFYFINVYNQEVFFDRITKDITEQEDEEIQNANACGWLYEQMEFAKLITIHRWEKENKEWYKNRYYLQITDTENRRDVKKDEMGMVENEGVSESIGVSMSKEEFELYKQLYHKLNLSWK